MAILSAKVDISGPLAAFGNLRREQLPWTIARALTRTAQQGQAEARRLESQVFKLRNDWTARNTKITPATKISQVAEVFTDTSNWATGAPDYLLPQETGAEKVPYAGRQHLCIPTKYLRQMTGDGAIPQELRPRAMLQLAQLGNKFVTGRGRLRGQSAAYRGMVFFIARLKSGDPAIMGRYVTEREAYPMYLMVTSARIRARFPMEQTVLDVVNANFEENFKTAAIETIGNDLLAGSGVRIKL